MVEEGCRRNLPPNAMKIEEKEWQLPLVFDHTTK